MNFGIQSLGDGHNIKDAETSVLGMSSSVEGVAVFISTG